MDVDLTLKNYRCFPDDKPARISLRNGFTAFVGANNSGKSSIFRFLYEFRPLFDLLSQPTGRVASALRGEQEAFQLQSVLDPTEVFCNYNSRDMGIELEFKGADGESADEVAPPPQRVALTIPRNTQKWVAQVFSPSLTENLTAEDIILSDTMLVRRGGPQLANLSSLFHVCRVLAKAIYIGPFRNVINVGGTEHYFDIQVGRQFVSTWRSFQAGGLKRHNELIDRLTDDIRRIFRFGRLQILPSEDGTTMQLMIDGKSFKLPEVGSGIAQFILVLANAATKDPSFILIDEPELNLHPSLQLDFLTTLCTYSTHGVIFATHSIGLARAAADRIYSFRPVADGGTEVRELEATPRLAEFIGELSFSGYQELGFDNILLVEGRHDIKTIHQFLRRYKKEHQIVLLPLGGATLINENSEAELQEIKRISQNVSALIDSERDAPDAPLSANRQAFVDVCKRLSMPCHVLDLRAIENYFTDRALKAIKGEKYEALGPYQKLEDAPLSWGKEENWRIAREMTLEELQSTDLGQFLESL